MLKALPNIFLYVLLLIIIIFFLISVFAREFIFSTMLAPLYLFLALMGAILVWISEKLEYKYGTSFPVITAFLILIEIFVVVVIFFTFTTATT